MTPQEQLDKWLDEGLTWVYLDDDGKLKDRHAGEVIPCKWCEYPTHRVGAELCNECWEIDNRLDERLPLPALQAILGKVTDLITKK